MWNLFKNISFALVLLVILPNNFYTQSLNFHHYSTSHGLPQSTIYDIIQDSSGFLWFGTEAGIGRFDGKNVKTYGYSEGLIGINIASLFIDKYGSLWIGTSDGLSIMFEGEIKNYSKKDGLPDDYIYGITEDRDGNVWLATRYGGACKFNGRKIQVYNEDNGFPSNQLMAIYKDNKGNLWFASYDKGLIKFDGKNFVTYTINDGLASNLVLSIFEDSQGILWIGTDKGVTTFDGETFFRFTKREGFPEEEVKVIVEDKSGNIWIGLHNHGILRYDGRKIYKHYGLESDEVRSAYVDKRGDLWIGTFLGGLSRLPIDWFEIYDVQNGLVSNKIYPILEDKNGKMYIGHWGKGISIIENGNISNIQREIGLSISNLSSIIQDKKDDIWFGTWDGVVKVKNNTVRYFNKANGLKLDNIVKIFEDSKGYIWFGAIGGVSKYDPSLGKITGEYLNDFASSTMWVNDIFEDKNGTIWFATHNVGLINYDGKSFTKIDTSNGLPINNIYSITQDKKGYYWISTDGKGVCRYDGNEFIILNEQDGLSSDVCYYILENYDELYIGTLNGITVIKNDLTNLKNGIQTRYISKNEGLPSQELNQGSYLKDKNGYLWFGTQNGLVKIDPNKNVNDTYIPIYLNNIIVSDGINETSFKTDSNLDLNSEQNNLSFEFFSISFAKPNETMFEFMLEGVEDNWSKTKENRVTYRALPSGIYKFWVRAKNNSEMVNAKPKLLASFNIPAPFYKTWWFYTSSIVLFFLFIYSLYLYKTNQVKRRNEALEAMVKDRTRELEIEKNKSDDLLHNILPSTLVEELKVNGRVRPRKFNSVSIMFTDFKAFTYTTSVLPAEELVNELNDIFKNFDALIGKYGLEKLKTIGDSYMAACGIPNEIDDHAVRMVYAALDFQNMIKERNKTSAIKWDMRLGIHSGSVVAGVVGTKKFTYDIWGDTVNIASRMESSGEPGEINISGYTYMLIRDQFECEYRGKVDTKGKGGIDMYFVKSINRMQNTTQNYGYKLFKSFKQIN
ncbi:MAG: hypothetical protein H6609_15860 [Ignavibacteriales bacterium]|nr:hypothetical protein [Ignavibacteriales bacterium]